MQKYKIALIGCGRIGFLLEKDPLRNKPCTHYGGATSAGLTINYACDCNRQRLELFSSLANIPKEHLFQDYSHLLRKVRPEVVIIATWTESHAKIAICAAEHGAQIIVCEKPIASNLLDAEKLIASCNQNNVRLIINHERRFDPRYRTVKKILDTGKIGTIKSVYSYILTGGHYGDSLVTNGGGPLLHDGTHVTDLIGFLFGPVKTVYGRFSRQERLSGFEDHALAWIETRNNIPVFIEAGGNRNYFSFALDIYGTDGKISIGNGFQKLFKAKKSTLYKGFRDLKEVPFPRIPDENCFTNEYRYVKQLLQNTSDTSTSLSSGDDGYKALEIIHAAYLSSFKNQAINLPLKPKSVKLKKIFKLK